LDDADNKTPRPNRYVVLDFVEPVAGVSDADFEAALFRKCDPGRAGTWFRRDAPGFRQMVRRVSLSILLSRRDRGLWP
jgi:hypothetical protein